MRWLIRWTEKASLSGIWIAGQSSGPVSRWAYFVSYKTFFIDWFCTKCTYNFIPSGLDSSSSKHLIKLLTKLAREGHTIVCTIHQPSASEYDLFDYVYVMAEGFCVYQGASINTIPYLNSVGLHCPQYHSAADYSECFERRD